MLNIVVPMAGKGSRFANEGFVLPKPLIDVRGKPMIEWVIKNIKPRIAHKFIFIVQKEHCEKYQIDRVLLEVEPAAEVVVIDSVTEGALCTVLAAREFINSDDQVMIANSDQFIDVDINMYLKRMQSDDCDGLIMTMKANDPKWSFIKLDNQKVIGVVEKIVVSNEATVGIYNFKNGNLFLKAADKMISAGDRTNNEFYVAPAYNYLIKDGHNIDFFNIGEEDNGMYGLGIPADLKKFLNSNVSADYYLKYFK